MRQRESHILVHMDSLPIYFFSLYRAPTQVINTMEKIIANFYGEGMRITAGYIGGPKIGGRFLIDYLLVTPYLEETLI